MTGIRIYDTRKSWRELIAYYTVFIKSIALSSPYRLVLLLKHLKNHQKLINHKQTNVLTTYVRWMKGGSRDCCTGMQVGGPTVQVLVRPPHALSLNLTRPTDKIYANVVLLVEQIPYQGFPGESNISTENKKNEIYFD